GPGDDTIDGGPDTDTIRGGAGDDIIHAGSAGDTVDGGGGDDEIFADSGPDTIRGGDGDDVVYVNNGTAARAIDCGPGHDTLYINPSGSAGGGSNVVMLRDGRFVNCESVIEADAVTDPAKGEKYLAQDAGGTKQGTDRDDNLLGGVGADRILGLGGDDVVWGMRFADRDSSLPDHLDGGPGNDTIYGGRGGRNTILGGPGDDRLQGGERDNVIDGGSGDDDIRVRGRGRNVVRGGAGHDVIHASAKTRDRISCGSGRDTVYAGRGDRAARDCERVVR
ncbi:MAG: hypothetical protein QOF29_3715, partial [bacterium]